EEEIHYQAATTARDYIQRLRLRPLSVLQDTADEELQSGLDRLEAEMGHQLTKPVYEVGHALVARRIADAADAHPPAT
ncbi:MAG: hypothetical protein M3285_03075, partial [Actinomycetota bacterium]|nr:hypothetical protein [Actinomycetota bacterium]